MPSMTGRGKYRWRTWVRGRAPQRLTDVLPKGADDCGAHEWYRADEETWRCYHCEPGITHTSPWPPKVELATRLDALRLRATALQDKQPTPAVAGEVQELISEVSALVESGGSVPLEGSAAWVRAERDAR